MTLAREDHTDRTTPERAPARKPFWRRPPLLPLAVAAVFYIYLQTTTFVRFPEDQAPLQPHEGFPLYFPLLLLHITGATLAMLTMVLQVWPWLLRRHPKVHRVAGRVYVVSALVAGSVGLVIVWWAPQPGKLGALCQTLFWLATTAAAYRAVRRKEYEKHRRFMLYSFAIISSNMVAPYIAIALGLLGITVDPVYLLEGSRWITWVGALMTVQWWLYRTARPAALVEQEPELPRSLRPKSFEPSLHDTEEAPRQAA